MLHDIPANRSFAQLQKSLATEVTQPSITIDKTGSIQSGQAPQNVTYTLSSTNDQLDAGAAWINVARDRRHLRQPDVRQRR